MHEKELAQGRIVNHLFSHGCAAGLLPLLCGSQLSVDGQLVHVREGAVVASVQRGGSDALRIVEPVDRLRQRIIVGIAIAAAAAGLRRKWWATGG